MQQTFSGQQPGKPKEKGSHEKSIVVLHIMPQTAQTDMMKVKNKIMDKIKMDGLNWGQTKMQDVAYGIKKLVMGCVIEDRVSMDDITQQILAMQEVQAVDIASFNKV